MIPPNLSHLAASLHAELLHSWLDVVLVPARSGTGMVRSVQSRNPRWYRDFCAQFPSSRVRRNHRLDTRIRRRWMLRALQSWSDGQPVTYYRSSILELLEREAAAPLERSA